MNPLFHTDCSISDSLKSVRKSVLIYETIIEYDIPIEQTIEQEVDVMCNLSQGIKETGIAEGRAEEIIETGYEFGLSEQDILERLQKKLSISLQKAQEYLLMFGKRTV